MRLHLDLEGWTLNGEKELLEWLRSEAEAEDLDTEDVQFILTGDEQIRELNESYLEHEGTTDVITFDYRNSLRGEEGEADSEQKDMDAPSELEFMDLSDQDEDFPDAEIYVSLETARSQSVEFGCTITEEVSRLLLHGILHLAGWDDETAAKRRAMNRREDQGLARAGRESGVLAWQVMHPVEMRG